MTIAFYAATNGNSHECEKLNNFNGFRVLHGSATNAGRAAAFYRYCLLAI
jgi:hypothetical protein